MRIDRPHLRICCLIPSLETGGMERVMSVLINGFINRHNADVHVVLYGKGRGVFYDIPPEAIIHRPSFPFVDSQRTLMTLKTAAYLRKEIKKINPDTILSFGEIWNNLVLISTIGLKYPIYVSDRCQPTKSFGRWHNLLRKYLYPRAAGVIAQTEKAKECYRTQFKHKNISVIGNPIQQIDIPENNKRENIVISVGRLIDTKNYDQLIDIFARINKPDWKLVIIGGDALKQHNSSILQKQIDNLCMCDRIILAGTQKDIKGYLLRAKIFAFTSSSEGFPNVIGEAMSAGLPVVAYDCIAGPSDMIVNGENGYLIPLFDKEKFKERLEYLMDNQEVASFLGVEAKCGINKFSEESIVSEYYKVLSSI